MEPTKNQGKEDAEKVEKNNWRGGETQAGDLLAEPRLLRVLHVLMLPILLVGAGDISRQHQHHIGSGLRRDRQSIR